MKEVPWSQILKAADTVTDALPIPFPANVVVDLAITIAGFFLDQGCTIEGCPADIKARLMPADIPAEDNVMFDARSAAEARILGLDHKSFRKRFEAIPSVVDGEKDRKEYLDGMKEDRKKT